MEFTFLSGSISLEHLQTTLLPFRSNCFRLWWRKLFIQNIFNSAVEIAAEGAPRSRYKLPFFYVSHHSRPAGDENIKFQFRFAFADSCCYVSNRQRVTVKLMKCTQREGMSKGRGSLRAHSFFSPFPMSGFVNRFPCSNMLCCPLSSRCETTDDVRETRQAWASSISIIIMVSTV